ncbi:MAG: phage tail protein [Ruminococcus sp.]|nr:phage tail protein [Ruminococcus sp.]
MYEITIENNGISTKIHEKSPDSPCRLSAGKLVEEINQIPSFSFAVSASNPCYADGLNDRKTLVKIINTITKETEFEGVLLTHETSMSSAGKVQKTAVCEGLMGYLCDTVQPYRNYEDTTVSQFLFSLLENHNAQTSADKQIFLGECDFGDDHKNSKTTAYRNTLEEIKVNLIDRIGGEMRVRRADGKLVLDFLKQCGAESDATVELAKNMKSLDVKTDSSDVVTRLIPLGVRLGDGETAERLTIAEINEGKPYIDDENAVEKYGIIVGTAVFDDITRAENLISAGREYLGNNNRLKKAYSAEVLDLSLIDGSRKNLKCGNTYRFKNSFVGLDENLRLKKRTVDIYKPFAPTVEIGDKSEKITDVAIRTNSLFEYELPKQKSETLAMAKAIATSLITNATTGFVVIRPDEILIMDTDNVETATRVWRWNSGGLGYSSTGYSGEYGLAMTMDGQIVADYITAGTLKGCEILNGDGTFHVDETGKVTADNITITGGSINIQTGDENFDVISLRQGDSRTALSPTGFVVRNSQTKRMISVNINGIYAYDDYDKAPEHTFSVSYQTGEINTSGGVFAGGNISAKDIHGDTLRSEGDVWAGGNAYVNNLYFKTNDGNGYYSLRDWIDYIRNNV